jgi:hypothetical protein
MVISVKNISQKQGGSGKFNHNDYEDIINKYGGVTNIKSIKPMQATIKVGEVIDSLQFVYNVVTEDGMSHYHKGNNCGGSGGKEKHIDFANDEQIKKISGRYGKFEEAEVIKYLEFQTSRAPYSFGVNSPEDSLFTLSGDILTCSNSDQLNSLGAYEIVEVPQKVITLPSKTVTGISTITDVETSIVTVDSSRNLAIGLGVSGFGVAVLVAIGAFS